MGVGIDNGNVINIGVVPTEYIFDLGAPKTARLASVQLVSQ